MRKKTPFENKSHKRAIFRKQMYALITLIPTADNLLPLPPTQAESGRNQAGENTPVQKNLGNGSLLRLSISSEKNPPGRRFLVNFS